MLPMVASIYLLALAATASVDSQPAATPVAASQPDRLGAIFAEWLTAFNANDPSRLKAFYRRYRNDPDPVFEIENAQNSCGLTVDHLVEKSATSMTVLLRQRCLPGLQRATMTLGDGAGDGVPLKSLQIVPLAAPGDGAIAATIAITDRLAAHDGFAGSLLIARGGKVRVARSWGRADPKLPAPITLDTPMFLASAGKMFTGVAILQLVDAGLVALDAPLGRYLTDYPNAEMAKVTVRQLLTHRGGTGDIGILGRDDGANRARVRTIADIVRLNGARPPEFTPGSKDDYSNYGFILLGAIIEKVTGASYYDYVAQHVFKPAGMTSAGFPDHDHLAGVAVGYTRFFGAEPALVANLDVLPWRGASAGGGVASANDMLKFFAALNGGRLLSPASFRLATTPGETPWYGMGFIAQSGERQSWGHGGTSYGMDVALHSYAHDDTVFICMAARDAVCNRIIFGYYFRVFGPPK